MNESKILRTACDSKWYAHSYSEYLADVAQTTSDFMAALQEVISLDNFAAQNVRDILLAHGINPEARFILGEYGSQTAFGIANTIWYETELPDGYVTNESFSLEEALAGIRGSWSQCIIASKAFDSYASDAKDSIDRVSKFIQDVQANFQIDDTVRDVISYYQSMINASSKVSDFVYHFLTNIGVDTADTSNDPMAYVNSEVYKYTGNTPGVSLDFSAANKAVTSTVRAVAKTIKGVFNVIGDGFSWLFNKAKKYVTDTVIDPAVCEYIGSDEVNDGYIDGFAWFGEFVPNVTHSYFSSGGQVSDLFSGFYDEYATKWIKIKLKVGEFLFRMTTSDPTWQCYFKPVAIDTDHFSSNYIGSKLEPSFSMSTYEQDLENYNSWLEGVMSCVQPVSKDATKDQLYKGLAFSTHLASSISMFAFIETYINVTGSNALNISNTQSILSNLADYYTFDPTTDTYSVTNAKILMAASGDPTDTNNIDQYMDWSSSTGVRLSTSIPQYSIRTMMTSIISIWALCRNERKLNPTSYTFVPYSNNHTSFTPASWRIKSDQQIAETRDNFIEKAIFAIVIVAAIVFIGATITKISKNAFFRRQQKLGQLENKMWNGGTLTASERRQYLRYNRKQNASRWLSAGSADSSSNILNDSQTIIKLIQG